MASVATMYSTSPDSIERDLGVAGAWAERAQHHGGAAAADGVPLAVWKPGEEGKGPKLWKSNVGYGALSAADGRDNHEGGTLFRHPHKSDRESIWRKGRTLPSLVNRCGSSEPISLK